MKVGTDGILLGAWTPIKKPQRALDVGTGTGLVALMLAQRAPEVVIEAIEIDPVAADQASQNAANSPFASRIAIRATALHSFAPTLPYDLILCNPPYFDSGISSEDIRRKQARHDETLRLEDLLGFAQQYLTEHGLLSLIIPRSREEFLLKKAAPLGLHPHAICRVQPNEHKPAHRSLVSLGFKRAARDLQFLAIRENGEYSQDYRALTEVFHPMF